MLEFRDAAVAGDAMDHGDEDYGIGYSGRLCLAMGNEDVSRVN